MIVVSDPGPVISTLPVIEGSPFGPIRRCVVDHGQCVCPCCKTDPAVPSACIRAIDCRDQTADVPGATVNSSSARTQLPLTTWF